MGNDETTPETAEKSGGLLDDLMAKAKEVGESIKEFTGEAATKVKDVTEDVVEKAKDVTEDVVEGAKGLVGGKKAAAEDAAPAEEAPDGVTE